MDDTLGTLSIGFKTVFPFIQVKFQRNSKCHFWSLWHSLWVPEGELRLLPFPSKWVPNKHFHREFLDL